MIERLSVTKEDKKAIEIARKYQLRLGTMKFVIFCLFEEGHSSQEVRYILRDMFSDIKDPLIKNISRYYFDWKKAQSSKAVK